MKIIYTVILFLAYTSISGQTYKQQNFEHSIHGLTTIVNILQTKGTGYQYSTFGTGFFYHDYGSSLPEYPNGHVNSVDSSLKSIWLITNKHVIFGKDNFERLKPPFPVAIEFYMRKRVKNLEYPIWDTIRLKEPDIRRLTKLHQDSLTDVISIDVTSLVLPKLLKGDSLYYYGAVSKANFPNRNMPVDLQGSSVGAGLEILSIGYPKNFYDKVNLFPTIKSGIVASKWEARYNGHRYFLIDAKLFPGSSGSIIITKPGSFGSPQETQGDFKFFQFLGVYSGEPFRQKEAIEFEEMTIIRKETYNIGIVWYYDLIEEIIK